MADMKWDSLKVQGPDAAGVALLSLHRPSRLNALDASLFKELPSAVAALDADPSVRVIILSGSGRHFCSGIDFITLGDVTAGSKSSKISEEGDSEVISGAVREADTTECPGRRREKLRRNIKEMQAAFTAFEECRKPVIAAVHGACIGGGVDMITACDLRYCTEDAIFSVKEVDLAITADLGTLQRLPGLVGEGNAMELALTGRRFSGKEAKSLGLVQGVFGTKAEMEVYVDGLAKEIARKSPLTVVGTKAMLVKSRDLTVAQGLEYVAVWNSAMLMSEDLEEAIQSQVHKRNPQYSKL